MGPGPPDDPLTKDRALVEACARGDEEAWQAFVDGYHRLIRHAVYRTLATRSADPPTEEIEDLTAEVLSCLVANDYRRLRTYEGRNNCRLSSWLQLVTTRLTLNHLERLRHWGSTPPSAGEPTSLTDDCPDKRPSAEEILTKHQEVETLRQALVQMSVADQLLIKLLYYQEWTGPRIATFLGVAESTIYSRKHRILKRLARLLAATQNQGTSAPAAANTDTTSTTGDLS